MGERGILGGEGGKIFARDGKGGNICLGGRGEQILGAQILKAFEPASPGNPRQRE